MGNLQLVERDRASELEIELLERTKCPLPFLSTSFLPLFCRFLFLRRPKNTTKDDLFFFSFSFDDRPTTTASSDCRKQDKRKEEGKMEREEGRKEQNGIGRDER